MLKRVIFIVVVASVLLLGTASISWGYGVFGATDLMFTPTAKSLDAGTLGIAVNLSEGDQGYFNFDYGLFSDLEAGIVIINRPNDDNLIRFRGKYNILREDRDSPALAIGVEDLGSENGISPYLVLSKSLSDSGVQGHIGVGGGNFDGLFGGLSVTLSNGSGRSIKQTALFLEAESNRINAGAKLGIGPNTKINFGMIDLDNWMAGVTFVIN